MKTFLNRIVLSALAIALLMVPAATAQAQGLKPAVVFSIASIDEQMADAEYLFEAAGQKDAFAFIKFGAGVYLDGLDTTKPIGGVMLLDTGEPTGLAFIPVKDLDKLLAKIPGGVAPEDVGDGMSKIATPTGEDVYLKETGGYVYLSNEKNNLVAVPADPTTLLAGLDKKYNIAVQANLQNIPEPLKQMAIQGIEQGYQEGLEGGLEDEDEDVQELIKKLGGNSVESMKQLVNESDKIMLGWGVDSKTKSTYFDFSMTAVQGSKLAGRLATLKDTKSDFSGFLLPDAAATLHFAGDMAPEDKQVLTALMTTMRGTAMKELEADEDLTDAQKGAAKEVLGTLLDVFSKTVDGGKLDGGAALLLSPGSLTFAGGGKIAGGEDLDKTFKKLIELGKAEPEFPEVKIDADSHGNVKFHTVSVPIPDDEEDAKAIFGQSMDAVVGIGPNSTYMAFGKDAVGTLKRIMDASTAGADKVVPPSQLNIALTPILKFAQSVNEEPGVAVVLEALENSMGKDKIRIISQAIENGSLTRFEIEEGILQAIGAGAAAAQGGAGPADDF